jgi:hypothetical protein
MVSISNFHPFYFSTDMAMSLFSWRTWLYAPRNDDKPRALRLPFSFPDQTKNLIEQIKKVY